MKKTVILTLVAFIGVMMMPSHAQESLVSTDANKPTMPNLFFTKEQRRILEAIRQGVVEKDTFVADEFLPLVVIEEVLPQEGEIEHPSRDEEVVVNAFVRNRTSGENFIWIDGKLFDVKRDSELLEMEGISINNGDLSSGDVIRGQDGYNQSEFEIKVGQAIDTDGYVNEQLPVIVRKTK